MMLYYSPDVFEAKVPMRYMRFVDQRTMGIAHASLQAHPCDLNEAITDAVRSAYIQGMKDATEARP